VDQRLDQVTNTEENEWYMFFISCVPIVFSVCYTVHLPWCNASWCAVVIYEHRSIDPSGV